MTKRRSLSSLTVVAVCFVCGSTSATADTSTGADLMAVAASGGVAIAVGKAGTAFRYVSKHKAWSREKVPTRTEIRAVSMVGKRGAWTAGVGGQTLRYAGGRWTSPPGGTGRIFHGIAMLASDAGVVVGAGGRIYARVDKRWDRARIKIPGKPDLRAVVALGKGRAAPLLAVGGAGTALWLGGAKQFTKYRVEKTGVETQLRAVAACGGRRPEAAAAGDEVVLRDRKGSWRRLPKPPTSVRGIVLRCRAGRVRELFVVGRGAWRLATKQAKWRPVAGVESAAMNAVAWFDRHRLVVVGDKGFKQIVDTRKHNGAP